jgi:hypothetical protein
MRDITSAKWLFIKAALFLLLAVLAAGILLLRQPNLPTLALLLVGAWSAARAYYFAFYVLERYVDPSFRYAGIGSLLSYLLRRLQ